MTLLITWVLQMKIDLPSPSNCQDFELDLQMVQGA
jgi:hypothetical protein